MERRLGLLLRGDVPYRGDDQALLEVGAVQGDTDRELRAVPAAAVPNEPAAHDAHLRVSGISGPVLYVRLPLRAHGNPAIASNFI